MMANYYLFLQTSIQNLNGNKVLLQKSGIAKNRPILNVKIASTIGINTRLFCVCMEFNV